MKTILVGIRLCELGNRNRGPSFFSVGAARGQVSDSNEESLNIRRDWKAAILLFGQWNRKCFQRETLGFSCNVERETLQWSAVKCSLLDYLSVFQHTRHVFKSLHNYLLLKIIKSVAISFLITSLLSFPPLASFAFCWVKPIWIQLLRVTGVKWKWVAGCYSNWIW